jgi:Flp pilus assembly protein TadD
MRRVLLMLALLATWPALAVMPDAAPEGDADRMEGERAVRTGRYELGIPFLRDALARSPNEPDIHVYLALALRQTGKPEEAARHYAEALRLEPNHKGALAYQGVLHLTQGDRAGAEANLARLRTLCPRGCVERDELAREMARVAAR